MSYSRILLAVSGGIDSMYLANRASELFPGASFAIAHCNFSLRGEESDGDEAFVRAWAEKNEIKLYTIRFDTKGHAARRGISIEMAARELRYAWFEKLMQEEGFDALATAHNANDNAETLVLNLLRGTGIKGAIGMPDNDRLRRPLLETSREEIRAWMTAHGCEWREDSSNSDSSYRRNLVRNEIFPLFEKINPSFVKTLNDDMARFRQVSEIADTFFEITSKNILRKDGSIDVNEFLGYPHKDYLLWRLVENSGIGADEFISLFNCVVSGENYSGKSFGPVLGAPGRLIIKNREQELCETAELKVEILDRSEIAELKQERGVLIMDASKLEFPLKIRSWQAGDWMRPYGMRGSKNLTKLMTELGYSLDEKKTAQVIELDGKHVAALLCERIDSSLRVTERTKEIVRISYSKI